MKTISVAIPCYNSAAYMGNCIESLLVDLDEVEIIIVNDGSTKDNTAEVAEQYRQKYPNIIKVINKENGGHGSAVNAGIKNASGKYFKIVDSDDKVDPVTFKKMVEFLKTSNVDMLLTEFVYDKVGQKNKKIMKYNSALPTGKEFTWDDIKWFNPGQYILMHSIVYKTSVLRKCKLSLPKHTFYVDNLYAYIPLPYVKTMYYFDEPVYYYYLGRDDQSVSPDVLIKRLDQHLRVNKLMFKAHDLDKVENKKLSNYMYKHLTLLTSISHSLCLKEGSAEKVEMKNDLWNYLNKINIEMYNKLRYRTFLGHLLHVKGSFAVKVNVLVYTAIQKMWA